MLIPGAAIRACVLVAVSGISFLLASASNAAAHTSIQASTQAAVLPIPDLVQIPAGSFIAGSSPDEREAAYKLDEAAYGHSTTRQQRWYATERPRSRVNTGAFTITRTPITNNQYAAFVSATDQPAPDVDRSTWNSYGLNPPFKRTRRFAWKNAHPPDDRGDHPVVLVSQLDAGAYAAWLTGITGSRWRLPTEEEWEKAARGSDGRRFPWGDTFDPARLNSNDGGPFDTQPVGSYPSGASPYGVFDAAGQVYEWTASLKSKERAIVKGGSWDDSGCGVCRPAARHSRPITLKHILIGFRLVRE